MPATGNSAPTLNNEGPPVPSLFGRISGKKEASGKIYFTCKQEIEVEVPAGWAVRLEKAST
jgi:hypothetical protein